VAVKTQTVHPKYKVRRRCGVSHYPEPTIFADGYFSKDEIARLQADPRLEVDAAYTPKPGDQVVSKKTTEIVPEAEAAQDEEPKAKGKAKK
jgi:hypothetical protein